MPNEKANEKRQGDLKGSETPGDTGEEREVQGSETDEHEGRERQGRERREMEQADPRVGRGGEPVGAGVHEDEEDTGDGAVIGRV